MKPHQIYPPIGMTARIKTGADIPPLLGGRYGRVMLPERARKTRGKWQSQNRVRFLIELWADAVEVWVPHDWLLPLAPDEEARLYYTVGELSRHYDLRESLGLARDWANLFRVGHSLAFALESDEVLTAQGTGDFKSIMGAHLQEFSAETQGLLNGAWEQLLISAASFTQFTDARIIA